ncbi:MAG TPA: ATP-binding protein [Vicinamibacteria bacterium]|nr:ATP-binding protein [Vicinamibacteria bacterium]
MPAEQLERLLERRERGDDARRRRPEGMGLGLHIAKGVADRHGFELRLAPSEHGGLEAAFMGPLR